MEWLPSDFEKMRFNVSKVGKNQSVFREFPELEGIPELAEIDFSKYRHLTQAKLLKFICYLYDPGTPLNKIEDLYVRKTEASILSGFKMLDTKTWSAEVEDMLIGKNDDVNKMIIGFLRMTNNIPYSKYITYYEAYWYWLKKVLEGVKDARTNVNQFEKDLKNLEKELFKENNDGLRRSLYKSIEVKRRLELRPEDYAKKAIHG